MEQQLEMESKRGRTFGELLSEVQSLPIRSQRSSSSSHTLTHLFPLICVNAALRCDCILLLLLHFLRSTTLLFHAPSVDVTAAYIGAVAVDRTISFCHKFSDAFSRLCSQIFGPFNIKPSKWNGLMLTHKRSDANLICFNYISS